MDPYHADRTANPDVPAGPLRHRIRDQSLDEPIARRGAALAFRQWQELHDVLDSLGVRVETMTPRPGLPDLVFTANAGLVFLRRS